MQNNFIYVLFNRELGLFFGGFGCKYTKYIQNAKQFCDINYAYKFACRYDLIKDFKVYNLQAVSREVLYAQA